MKTLKFAFEINWPLKLSLSFLNKAVDNNDNSSLKTFVQELSNADPTLYLSHQDLHDLCKFEKNFENTGRFNQEPHYFKKNWIFPPKNYLSILPFEQKVWQNKITHSTLISLQPLVTQKEEEEEWKKICQNFINLVGIHRCFIAYSNNWGS